MSWIIVLFYFLDYGDPTDWKAYVRFNDNDGRDLITELSDKRITDLLANIFEKQLNPILTR